MMKFSAVFVAGMLSSLLACQLQAQDASNADNAGRPGRLDLLTLEQKVANGQSFHTHQSEAVEPFRILGNIYFVGASNIASYLITSPEGHYLLDTGVQGMTAAIKRNVEALGFNLHDIKVILSSHAHFDHIQGHAIMQRMTGAQVFALEADAEALEAGKDLSPLGFEGWEPVKVDRRLQDGESIHLGGVTLTPTWAPGHSPGCTTWSMQTQDAGEDFDVVFFGCNGPNDGVQLINNPRFPTLVEDALFGFDNMAKLQADIYLTGHPQTPFEGIDHLMRVQVRPHPLMNQQPWAEFIAARKLDFEARVQAERAALQQALP
ncbi:subclass B3 metallo-beta-lactamase [Gammaproteobacteria bacterium LSUCC0112]|nr:subclass B3 metallo-beta-lactamase [Gammaproteobacteria bacterium LSUCC0112]